jgi:hypothetical protein
MFEVEVAYATPEKQKILSVRLMPGSTVQDALDASGIEKEFPGIDLANAKVGIFSEIVERDTVLRPYDRIEIYRPLSIDPKAARIKRVGKNYLPRRVR